MPTSDVRHSRSKAVASAVLGLLLTSMSAASAYAESMRSQQWHLDAMRAEEMWRISNGDGVTVAVIDTGVDPSNPDLAGRVLNGKDLAPGLPGDEHTDPEGHGTGMAGLIAGTGQSNGGRGAFGLAPGAKILPIRLDDSGKAANQVEGDRIFNANLTTAIRYAADKRVKVINISMSAPSGSQEVAEAVRYALDKGSLIFAGVGNDAQNGNEFMYPAATPGVVGVGAIGEDLKKSKVSQYGPQVDISAPGVNMIHACGGGTGLCRTSGTSDATAIASASAALIWSQHPDWTNNQVLRVLLNTAGGPVSGDKRTDFIGYGIVRPRIALKTPGDPGPADEYPLPDLAVAESPEPSAVPSKAPAGSEASNEPAAAAPAADDGGSNTALWTALGIGAAALIGAGGTAVAVRSRRRKAAASLPQPYQPAPGYPQPQPPYRAYGPPSGTPGGDTPYDGSSGQGPTT